MSDRNDRRTNELPFVGIHDHSDKIGERVRCRFKTVPDLQRRMLQFKSSDSGSTKRQKFSYPVTNTYYRAVVNIIVISTIVNFSYHVRAEMFVRSNVIRKLTVISPALRAIENSN